MSLLNLVISVEKRIPLVGRLHRRLVRRVARWLARQMRLGYHYDLPLYQAIVDWQDEEIKADAIPGYREQFLKDALGR